MKTRVVLLDGPMGTELGARGVALPAPLWSAHAIGAAPAAVADIHRSYVAAGATVHRANTFRTKRRQAGATWKDLAHAAVSIARAALPKGHRLAGSVAPLEDCYRPDLSPPDAGAEHLELARFLADCGVDLLLCETFPSVAEALACVDACLATGLETWASFTGGPDGSLLTPDDVGAAAVEVAKRGASAVLFNCTAASKTLPYVERLARAGIPFGAFANAGDDAEGLGWGALGTDAAERYADLAEAWIRTGASIVGGCCGTGPEHIAALSARVRSV